MAKLIMAAALTAAALFSGGCVLIAAAGAGYLVHDEVTECDDKFDPLEDVRDEEDGCN